MFRAVSCVAQVPERLLVEPFVNADFLLAFVNGGRYFWAIRHLGKFVKWGDPIGNLIALYEGTREVTIACQEKINS